MKKNNLPENCRHVYVHVRDHDVLLSGKPEENLSVRVALHISNETDLSVNGTMIWRLIDESRSISGTVVLIMGSQVVSVPSRTTVEARKFDFSDLLSKEDAQRKAIFFYDFIPYVESSDKTASVAMRGSILFVPLKMYEWRKVSPSFSVRDTGDQFEITIKSSVCVRAVELTATGFTALFSHNYFDLAPGDSLSVTVNKNDVWEDALAQTVKMIDVQELTQALHIRTFADAE